MEVLWDRDGVLSIVNRQTPVKAVPSRRTTYAGGKNVDISVTSSDTYLWVFPHIRMVVKQVERYFHLNITGQCVSVYLHVLIGVSYITYVN